MGHGLDDIARFSGLHWRAGGLHGMWVMVWMILHGSQGYIGGQEGCTECGSWLVSPHIGTDGRIVVGNRTVSCP